MKNLKIIIIFFCVISIACGSKTKNVEEIHKIPDGYVGRIVIIFNQPDGLPIKYEEGARIYEIPKSGILKTQFKNRTGRFDDENTLFYYVNNDRITKRLYLKKPGDFGSDSLVAFPMVGMNIGFGDVKYEHVVEYYIGIPKSFDETNINPTQTEIENWNSE